MQPPTPTGVTRVPARDDSVRAYRRLTQAPTDSALLAQIPVALAPLPEVVETDLPGLPALPSLQGESLAPVVTDRVADLAAYRAAGWAGAPIRSAARTEVVARLSQAAEALPAGFGLAVFDAWRSLDLQRRLFHQAYDNTDLEPGFVSLPSEDPAEPPPHLTGGTVDLTLTWQGSALALGSYFDQFDESAHMDSLEFSPSPERELRRLLAQVMLDAGFAPYASEWWHWEYGTRRWAAWTGREALYRAASPPDDG